MILCPNLYRELFKYIQLNVGLTPNSQNSNNSFCLFRNPVKIIPFLNISKIMLRDL